MAVLDTNEIFYTTFEPKTVNRGMIYIDGIPAFTVFKMKKPSFTVPAKEIHHINSYFNFAGKRKWDAASMTMYDPVTPSGAQAVMDWARLTYEAVTGRAGYIDFYKKDLVYNDLGPVGDVISEWIYKGAFVTKMDNQEVDWTNEGEAQNITIEVTYDYAILNY